MIGSLLLAGCNKSVNVENEQERIFACWRSVSEYLGISDYSISWDKEEEAWASFVLNWRVNIWNGIDEEKITKNVQCVVDMVDKSVTIQEVSYDLDEYPWELKDLYHAWHLVWFNHELTDISAELMFTDKIIWAKFCNDMGSDDYSIEWNTIHVRNMVQNEMLCDSEELMEYERKFDLSHAKINLVEHNLRITTSNWDVYDFYRNGYESEDEYNQFLEAIKSSWEQPQGKNNLIIPAFDDINKVVDKCGDDSYDYNVYQKAYILPYKDWYIWYQLWWQDGWELYLTYRKLGEPCNIISQSDNIFWWNPYYKEWQETFRWASYPDNKIYIAQWLFSWVPTEEIVKELNCIPGNNFEDHDHTCMKEADKYFYDLIVWNEENEYFTQWMNKLKEDIDNEDYKTFSYYREEYDTCSQKVVDLIWALQPNQDEKARWEYQVKRTENMHKCVLENLNK